jgi:COP9 signalosome complex subunit 6
MAAGKEASANPLVTSKARDSSLSVQLHPLVLLTISDYITRHTLRSQSGPVLGAVIGQQSGRNYTLEHAFECKTVEQNGQILLDSEWFRQRLEQYKDVHKAPALDLVALFVTGPVGGPQDAHLPAIKQVQQMTGMEGIMLLMFHGTLVDQLQGGKLPISLYETVQEQEGELKFRDLSFEVETGDAEMIGVDFVAKGSGTATAVTRAESAQAAESSKKEKGKGKGKAKEKEKSKEEEDESLSVLSPEDDELLASLTAKANAIKMLNQRINLIRTYLEELPESYLTDASSTTPLPDTINHPLLRSINSLLSRIPLLAPPRPSQPSSSAEGENTTLQAAGAHERQDVHLTSLLAALSRSVAEAQSMGAKFSVLQREKQNKERGPFGGGGGRRMDRYGSGYGNYADDGSMGDAAAA